MRGLYKNLSITQKNFVVIVAVMLFVMVIIIAVMGFQAISTIRQNLVAQIDSVSRVIASNASVSIDFDDTKQGTTILSSLRSINGAISGVIYRKNGKPFVYYQQKEESAYSRMDKSTPGYRYRFFGNEIHLVQDITYNDEIIGKLYIIVSTQILSDRIISFIWFAVVVFIIILPVGTLLGWWFSRNITRPILKLSDTTTKISRDADYSVRVEKETNDEIGVLYDSFNNMLENISQKNQEIHKLNESLEERVRQRTLDLLSAKEHAEQADRTKSTFLANMSHEIRTPMNSILGYSRLLNKQITDPKQKEYLDIVETSGRNLLALIEDILDLSKIEAGKIELDFKAVDTHALIEEIGNIFRIKTREKGIDFIIEEDPAIPQGLILDETRIRQILFNLVGNAVKFTEEGHIKLTLTRTHPEKEISKVHLIFIVEDTGIGIAEDQIERIFHAFEQQKGQSSRYGGTGLGLAITKRLVEIMNGTISVSSQVGQGSLFTFELPEVEISPLQVTKTVSPLIQHESLDFQGACVLVVEDNPHNLALIRSFLEAQNIKVEEAENAHEAVNALKSGNIHPGLILMDMKTPVMDGFEATRLLKSDERLSRIPIIALTAFNLKDEKEKLKNTPCDGFLIKPIDEDRLFEELKKHLPFHHKEPVKRELTGMSSGFENYSFDLTGIQPSDVFEIHAVLSTQLQDRWAQLGDSLILDRWTEFAAEIRNLGKKFNISPLLEYAGYMAENIDNLNIKELKKTIQWFPSLVENIKRMLV